MHLAGGPQIADRGAGVEEEGEGEVVRGDAPGEHAAVEAERLGVERGIGELGEGADGAVEEGEGGGGDGGEDEEGDGGGGEGGIEGDKGGGEGVVVVEVGSDDVGVGLL